MARPQKEGLEYFPHDVYASSDEKIEPLILLYGAKGYAFYFIHLEYIYRNKDLCIDISDAETREVIQQKLHISAEEYEQILQTALKKRCYDKEFYETTGKLTSDGVKKRAAIVTEKRDKMRVAYESKKQGISAAETREETPPETPQSKVKKSKEKKSNNIYTPEFEKFYSEYPRPEDKHRTFTNWKTQLKTYTVDQLMTACANYKKAKVGTETQYLKSSANFLGKEKPFEDFIKVPAQQSKSVDSVKREDLPDFFLKANGYGGK